MAETAAITTIAWLSSLDEGFRHAEKEKRPLFVDFFHPG